jgi:hypothetical protein
LVHQGWDHMGFHCLPCCASVEVARPPR